MMHGNTTHGHTALNPVTGRRYTSEFSTWQSMLNRCHRPGSTGYHKYGAVGVSVCQRWRESFEAFLADMGPKPSPEHSIDRFPNQTGNYEPGNCRWATLIEQSNNIKTNRRLTARGKTRTMAEWGRISGIDPDTIWKRLELGWDPEAAIFQPLRKAASKITGIYWAEKRKKWCASIRHDGKDIFLGRHASLIDAASALLGNLAAARIAEATR